MGFFKKKKHRDSDSGEMFDIFTPTVFKKGKDVIFIKGKSAAFVKGRKK